MENLSETFRTRLSQLVPSDKLKDVQESFSSYKPSTFRVNTIKVKPEEVERGLQKLGFEIQKVDWLPNAYILKSRTQRELTETDIYKNGFIYIQSLSSMIPPLVLNPQPNEKVLDITAAPGSKTTQMSALMENSGEILANDRSRVRLYKLSANLKTLGVTNVRVTHSQAQIIWKKYPGYFDKTLVDVPCSMEGRIQTNSPKTYKNWSVKNIKRLATYQKEILRSAFSATKPGGIIVYSTCTLAPEENEEVIDWLLRKEQGKVTVEKIDVQVPQRSSAILDWQDISYSDDIKNTLRILPSEETEGFFVAKLTKLT